MVISFASIFSHSVGHSLVLLMVSFAVQKLLSLIRPRLFTFAFISVALGDRSKNISLRFMSKTALPMFSSRSFMVSDLTFRSSVHFEFISFYFFLSSLFLLCFSSEQLNLIQQFLTDCLIYPRHYLWFRGIQSFLRCSLNTPWIKMLSNKQ